MIAKLKNIIVPIIRVENNSFESFYELSIGIRLVRYIYVFFIVGIGYKYIGPTLSLIYLAGIPILWFVERRYFFAEVREKRLHLSIKGFLSVRHYNISLSEITGIQYRVFSNQLIIGVNGQHSITIPASLPPLLNSGENTLEKFLVAKLKL